MNWWSWFLFHRDRALFYVRWKYKMGAFFFTMAKIRKAGITIVNQTTYGLNTTSVTAGQYKPGTVPLGLWAMRSGTWQHETCRHWYLPNDSYVALHTLQRYESTLQPITRPAIVTHCIPLTNRHAAAARRRRRPAASSFTSLSPGLSLCCCALLVLFLFQQGRERLSLLLSGRALIAKQPLFFASPETHTKG